jgi:hypothetical protein
MQVPRAAASVSLGRFQGGSGLGGHPFISGAPHCRYSHVIFAGMRAAFPGERWWTLMLEGVINLTVAAPCSSGWRLR